MAGIYPDNETLKLFGKSVSWPGVDENGKFTNGSFSDPDVPPSFIPAETINLILDNLSELIIELGATPNNQSPDQLALAIKNVLALKAAVEHRHTGGDDSPQIETNGIADIEADTTSAKAVFSNTAITFATFLQTVWRGITWLTAKLNASSGHKHTGETDDAPRVSVTALDYPIGWKYIQLPNDKTPPELGLVGNWENWNARAELYGLSSSLPSYATFAANTSYAAGAYVLFTSPEGDQEIFKAKEAVTTSNPAVFDPIKWAPLSDDSNASYRPTFVARIEAQASWSAADLAINATVSNAPVSGNNGKKVACKLVLGGKFPSFAGGNRPPFKSGGLGRDAIRNIFGNWKSYAYSSSQASGAVTKTGNTDSKVAAYGSDDGHYLFDFSSSRVIPVGLENSPRTISVQYWRRVS